MAPTSSKIDQLAQLLERTGGDPKRLEAVRRTQRFRRSWMELAEILCEFRREARYKAWGYEDFYEYCASELTLKRPTVDKLTISWSTIQQHAPQVLKWDGVAQPIPSYQAVDYFSRALGKDADAPPRRRLSTASAPPDDTDADTDASPPEDPEPTSRPANDVLVDLRRAVFDEGQSVAELKRRFDPVLRPAAPKSSALSNLMRATGLIRRLAELLPDLEGLKAKRAREVEGFLGLLREELESLAGPLRESAAPASPRAAARSARDPELKGSPKPQAAETKAQARGRNKTQPAPERGSAPKKKPPRKTPPPSLEDDF